MNFFEILLARYLGGGSGGGGSNIKRIELKVTENGKYIAPSGKAYSEVDVKVPIPIVEELNVSENGIYTAPSGKSYSPVNVDVPIPEGTISINSNGTYDVSSYENALVSVTASGDVFIPVKIINNVGLGDMFYYDINGKVETRNIQYHLEFDCYTQFFDNYSPATPMPFCKIRFYDSNFDPSRLSIISDWNVDLYRDTDFDNIFVLRVSTYGISEYPEIELRYV